MTSEIHILLYYKFIPIADTGAFKTAHEARCAQIGLRGKVLVAHEGINGSVSGTREQTEAYKQYVHALPGFEDVVFKEEISRSHPFNFMKVKVRKEIIRIDQDLDMTRTGTYIEPAEFLQLMERGEDIVLLDTRNDYESAVGKFKGAITPNISTFREFPQYVEKLKDKKDAKIVMYCTGGIRCEKASAYMIQQGFTNVSQLHGGIITFCQQYPNTVWEGKCFVFDKRLLSSVETEQNLITSCSQCGTACELYKNCKNPTCDALIPLCPQCDAAHEGCCSESCQAAYHAHLARKTVEHRGKRAHL